MFPDRQESTFALYHCMKAFGFSISYFLSATICVIVKLYITLGLFAVSSILYIFVEIDHAREKQSVFISKKTNIDERTSYVRVVQEGDR